jgi:hypothetical protein
VSPGIERICKWFFGALKPTMRIETTDIPMESIEIPSVLMLILLVLGYPKYFFVSNHTKTQWF